MELDWEVGELLKKLDSLGIVDNTDFVVASPGFEPIPAGTDSEIPSDRRSFHGRA